VYKETKEKYDLMDQNPLLLNILLFTPINLETPSNYAFGGYIEFIKPKKTKLKDTSASKTCLTPKPLLSFSADLPLNYDDQKSY
jgi:hypothetical protein